MLRPWPLAQSVLPFFLLFKGDHQGVLAVPRIPNQKVRQCWSNPDLIPISRVDPIAKSGLPGCAAPCSVWYTE